MTCAWISLTDDNIKCNRKSYDNSGYCLFHKTNKTENENKIMVREIKNFLESDMNITRLENDKYVFDFRGFIFEEDFIMDLDSSDEINNEDIIYDFSEAVFNEKTYFDNYKFFGDVYFDNTVFNDIVSFKGVLFDGNCVYYKTQFNDINLNYMPFQKTSFRGQNLVIKNIENMPKLDGIEFSQVTKFIIQYVKYDKEQYLNGRNAYRIARIQANTLGDHDRMGIYYYKERYYGGKIIKANDFEDRGEYIRVKIFDLTSRYVIGYGEKPLNVFIISFFIVSIFALLYMFVGVESTLNEAVNLDINKLFTYNMNEIISSYIKLWYFSVVTFATVGYGDIVPISISGRVLVILEIFLGVTMVASWASVLIKKMSR
jgi:hypothetical protein